MPGGNPRPFRTPDFLDNGSNRTDGSAGRSKTEVVKRQKLGKPRRFYQSGALIWFFGPRTFHVSELAARPAARPVGDVGDTPGHFFALIPFIICPEHDAQARGRPERAGPFFSGTGFPCPT